MSRARLTPAALLLVAAVFGPLGTGPPTAPSYAAAAAQLLPPGTLVDEARLEGGGFVRATGLRRSAAGFEVRVGSEWRGSAGLRLAEAVHRRRVWLGTDHQGRSVLSRVAAGARTSLIVALSATVIALAVATVVGLACALAPRPVRLCLSIGTDALLGLPRLLMLLILGVALRGLPAGLGLAIGLASWMEPARIVEAGARRIAASTFFAAALASGAGRVHLATRQVLPNLSPVLGVAAPMIATQAILIEATLSFLGLDEASGASSWGRIVADGQRMLPAGWWLVVVPGLLICAAALAAHRLAQPADEGPGAIVSP